MSADTFFGSRIFLWSICIYFIFVVQFWPHKLHGFFMPFLLDVFALFVDFQQTRFHQDWWFAVLQIQMWSDSQTISGVSSRALLYFSSPSWLFWRFSLSSLLRASVTLRGCVLQWLAFMCCSSSLKVSRVQTRESLSSFGFPLRLKQK